MIKEIKADLVAKDLKFVIIASRFNEFITTKLLEGATDTLVRQGSKEANIEIVWVPGSFELSLAAKRFAENKKYDAVICLGTIIRGDTPHFDFVAGETAKGISAVSLESQKPVVFGVITADTLEQAIERAGTKSGNKGRDAALSAIEMANLMKIIK